GAVVAVGRGEVNRTVLGDHEVIGAFGGFGVLFKILGDDGDLLIRRYFQNLALVGGGRVEDIGVVDPEPAGARFGRDIKIFGCAVLRVPFDDSFIRAARGEVEIALGVQGGAFGVSP